MMHDLHWKTGTYRLKITENILKGNETRETEMKVLLCRNIKKSRNTGMVMRDTEV